MEIIKNYVMFVSTTMIQIMSTIGGAGLIATGAYMLNSFLGLAENAQPWQYGLTGVIYVICMIPSIITATKATWNFYIKNEFYN